MPGVPLAKKLADALLRFGSISAATGLFLLAIMIGSPLIIFIDVTSVMLMMGTLCLMVWTYGVQPVKTTVGLIQFMVWPPGPEAWDADRLDTGVEVTQGAQRLTMLAGWVGVLIGLVQILQNLPMYKVASSPYLGPAITASLLTLVYALMINMLLWVPLERYCTLALKRGADLPPFATAHVPTPQPTATLKERAIKGLMLLIALMVGFVVSQWFIGLGK